METALLLWVLSASLIMTGLVGLVLPMLPGAPLLFLGLVLGAWADDFRFVGYGPLAVLAGLTVLTYIVDVLAGMLGARRFGASKRAMLGAAVGTVIGLFFGLPGIIAGPFLGAVIGELSSKRSLSEAGYAGLGTTLGMLVGSLVKLGIGLAMVGIFIWLRFF